MPQYEGAGGKQGEQNKEDGYHKRKGRGVVKRSKKKLFWVENTMGVGGKEGRLLKNPSVGGGGGYEPVKGRGRGGTT